MRLKAGNLFCSSLPSSRKMPSNLWQRRGRGWSAPFQPSPGCRESSPGQWAGRGTRGALASQMGSAISPLASRPHLSPSLPTIPSSTHSLT